MARRKDRFDWTTFALYASLIITGWLMLYAASYSELGDTWFSFDSSIGKQTVWIGISLAAFAGAQLIDSRVWRTFAYPIYIFALLALVGVLLFGEEVKGARSWINLAGVSFQPTELAKFATLLALCTFLGFSEMRLKHLKDQLIAVGIMLAPTLLILLQPDAGSALVFVSFLILFYREGMPSGYYAFGLFAGICLICGIVFPLQSVVLVMSVLAMLVLAITYKGGNWVFFVPALAAVVNVFNLMDFPVAPSILWTVNLGGVLLLISMAGMKRQRQVVIGVPVVIAMGATLTLGAGYIFNEVLKPHQQDRINVWLQPSQCDPQGALYNIIQSKVAIGSGGLSGKGFLDGSMTKLNFVPEQATDFIFSTIGEEQGFLGSAAMILLYLGLIMRIVFIGERSDNTLLRHFAYGLGGMLFFHYFVNIGMTMGIVPVVGIPLPFISRGGTALLSFSIMISVFLRMAKSRF